MKNRFVIMGAGSLGRELAAWLQTSGYTGRVVFLDDIKAATRALPVIGKIEEIDLLLNEEDCVLVGLARPLDREALTRRIEKHWPPTVFIHPNTQVAPRTVVQSGSMFLPFSLISTDARLGKSLLLNTGASVGHDVVLGDYCTLCSNVVLTGGVQVGNRVFFGTGATVAPGVKIGNDAYIGAGAVVVRDVPNGAKVFGNPARTIQTEKIDEALADPGARIGALAT